MIVHWLSLFLVNFSSFFPIQLSLKSPSRAWAPDTVRLEFAVAPALQPVLEVLLKILVGSGGDLKAGPPPRSKYERAIANLLAELGEGPAAAAEQ